MNAGYSKTPLVKKLGIKQGFIIKLFNEPRGYFDLLHDLPPIKQLKKDDATKVDFLHYFAIEKQSFLRDLPNLQNMIKQDGMIWISWDKTKSKYKDAVNENVVRNQALQLNLVDIKVCAVSEVWSGLKFVIPVKDRK